MIAAFVKKHRKLAGLTQPELAEKAGVGLRFVRELEQGKETVRVDKVNQVLKLFGYALGPVEARSAMVLKAESGNFWVDGHEADLDLKRRGHEKG